MLFLVVTKTVIYIVLLLSSCWCIRLRPDINATADEKEDQEQLDVSKSVAYSDGGKYFGGMIGSMRNGFGVLAVVEEVILVGNWAHDEMHGYGIALIDSTVFISRWNHTRQNGPGALLDKETGLLYVGEWTGDQVIGLCLPIKSSWVNTYSVLFDVEGRP